MAGIWLWRQAWLDAYDAALWITAFGLIEVDLFHFLQRKNPTTRFKGDTGPSQ
jgi:hypothetical protein